MRRRFTGIAALALALAASIPAGAQNLPEDVLALHWHPATAEAARSRTLAAAAWLERSDVDEDWTQTMDALLLRLDRSLERAGPVRVAAMDGLLAWLVRQRQVNLQESGVGFPEPGLTGVGALLQRDHVAGQLARKRLAAAWQAPGVWRRVAERTGEGFADAAARYWAPVLELLEQEGSESPTEDAWLHARAQADRLRRLDAAESGGAQVRIRDAVLRAEAGEAWRTGRWLDMVWLVYEGLVRLTQLDRPAGDLAAGWSDWLQTLDAAQLRELRLIDLDLPVIVAMLGDAATYMASPEQATHSALGELADVYARLALFAPDLAFYLDQPVREDVRRAVLDCNPDPLLVGPLPREMFERCGRSLSRLLDSGLDSEELVGGAQGPFATEFLRRELGLVSWQRASYIDGHLAWLLDAQCQPPAWINVLEWSLVADHLVRWIAQRPVFFTGSTWQATLDRLTAQVRQQAQAHAEWIDCITGQGSQRRDPVMRLLARHRDALVEVDRLLVEAGQRFYESVTRAGADIDLDGPADQITAYRPETLVVGPCPEANACGARAELPASRALLGLFPNAFLLADQLGLGSLALCYDEVRWVDRRSTPTRDPASRVADFHGRLSFELVGRFDRNGMAETVFRHRLTDQQTRHYLFAADDEDILALDCPQDLIGRSIPSMLPEDHPGMVPNRLTYFASAPTTPESQLLANWDRGAEWRDWFLTGGRVEALETASDDAMRTIVQAELAALSARRERHLTAPLINPARAGDADPLALAMAQVADTAALLRRVLELHYPRIIRQYSPVRSLLMGEAGLITRDRVRYLRDSGVSARLIPRLGLERVEQLQHTWAGLPAVLREQGQRAPELDFSLSRLSSLGRQAD